jgi:hypothetical protein
VQHQRRKGGDRLIVNTWTRRRSDAVMPKALALAAASRFGKCNSEASSDVGCYNLLYGRRHKVSMSRTSGVKHWECLTRRLRQPPERTTSSGRNDGSSARIRLMLEYVPTVAPSALSESDLLESD